MLLKKLISLTLFLPILFPGFSIAQTIRIDSLKKRLMIPAGEGEKLQTLFSLCAEQSSLNPDTLYQYAITAKKLALLQAHSLNVAKADYYIAVHYATRGLNDSSLAISNQYLARLRYRGDEKEIYVNFTLLKARVLDHSNKSKAGLDLLYPLLQEAKKRTGYVNAGKDHQWYGSRICIVGRWDGSAKMVQEWI